MRHLAKLSKQKKNFNIMVIGCLILCVFACESGPKRVPDTTTYPKVNIAGAMKNVMWKGELAGIIQIDTIQDKKGLYGIGPESYLTGEIMIKDGLAFVSRVSADSSMYVEQKAEIDAPFFVYANVTEWTELDLPEEVIGIKDLEVFINQRTENYQRPFAFKLVGSVSSANIHVQNLPKGITVSSPEEAHQGQQNYQLDQQDVEIVGFFSTQHQGVFTHHDSYLHLHLITQDLQQMGHLDKVKFETGAMKLYLPLQ